MSEFELHPYQVEGADFLSKTPRALLADEMGLGKSAQAIRATELVDANKVLVICPGVARHNWANEFDLFSKRQRYPHVILTSKDFAQYMKAPPNGRHALIISYDLVTKNIRPLSTIKWDAIVCDEAHYLKNHRSKRALNILGRRGRGGLIHPVKYVWCLTGTPTPNNATELYAIARAYNLTDMSYLQWRDQYTIWQTTVHGQEIIHGNNPANIPELKALIAQFTLRRKKDMVATQLPPLSYHTTPVDPGGVDPKVWFQDEIPEYLPEKLKREKEMVESILREGKPDDLIPALAAAGKALTTLRRFNGLQKVESCADLVKDMIDGNPDKKVVIFAIHRDVIKALMLAFHGNKYGVQALFGGTPSASRGKIISEFQNNPKKKVIVCQIQAAGTAINLTASDHLIFIEQSWVPAENAQAAMRCHRLGQTRPVTVQFLSLPGLVDMKITRALARKTSMISQILE